MEDGDTESENASRVIQDFVFLCRKIGGFCRYIIKTIIKLEEDIMVLNNVTKLHKILIKTIRLRERRLLGVTYIRMDRGNT